MRKLQIIKSIVTMNIRVPGDVLEQRLVASPEIIGQELARQIHTYTSEKKLGYYPALEYFYDIPSIDPDLLDGIKSIVWFVTELLQSELKFRLRRRFSHVEIDDLQSLAFMMPSVRPNHLNAMHELTKHYTPDQVKVTLKLSNMDKVDQRGEEEVIEEINDAVKECLVISFDDISITSHQLLRQDI